MTAWTPGPPPLDAKGRYDLVTIKGRMTATFGDGRYHVDCLPEWAAGPYTAAEQAMIRQHYGPIPDPPSSPSAP